MRGRNRGLRRSGVLLCGAVMVASMFLSVGCGGSGDSNDSTVAQDQLEAAKRQGEEAAEERDRLDRLQRRVARLARQNQRSARAAVASAVPHETVTAGSAESSPEATVLRSFHAPSGNVSCEILSDGALCTVSSTNETFTFSNGEAVHAESGAQLPSGAGELAPYGTTIAAGSIVCTVPPSDSPHGVICADEGSGHGFEASRVLSRQRVY